MSDNNESYNFEQHFKQYTENNYGIPSAVPPGVSIADNIARAQQYQASVGFDILKTLAWFDEYVKNNSDKHLPQAPSSWEHSMDYKQLNEKGADGNVIVDYADFSWMTVTAPALVMLLVELRVMVLSVLQISGRNILALSLIPLKKK